MIRIGYNDIEKIEIINRYVSENSISKVYLIYYYPLSYDVAEHIPYAETIMYRTFYPLLQKIDSSALIVMNECLRTQNRNDLTYNCIRHYQNRTKHQIIFQWLPLIDTQDDFMALFDFDTQSKWKMQKFSPELFADIDLKMKPIKVSFNKIDVPTNAKTKEKYEADKAKIFETLGGGDPHVIPRTLHMIGSKDKQAFIRALSDRTFVTRNARFKPSVVYGDAGKIDGPIVLVDFPHRFIDFSDFLWKCGRSTFDVLVTDLKVDGWYFKRYKEWSDRLESVYTALQK